MVKVVELLLCVCVHLARCVPPSPTSAVTDMIQAEFGTLKNTMKVLSDQWEKWNTLFITSLEPRITSTASTLASIDSNIHNLQERAHVWDTFQLHVSAWNEQLASLDRKIDIISKGQEKVISLESKINTMLSMEYKLDNTIKILNNLYDSVTNLDTSVQAKKINDALFGEFATRGVLSSIKMVEKKLDRLLITNQQNMVKTDEKPNLTIKCNTPRVLEDLLNDISSKVDVIFDSIGNSSSDDEEDGDYDNEYLEVKTGSGDNAEYRHPSKSKRLRKAVRKTLVPYNHINAAIEELLNRAKRIENASLVLLDRENTILEKISEGSKRTSDCKVEEHLHHYSNEFVRNSNRILDSYFREQRSHFESVFSRLNRKCYDLKPTIDVSKSSTEISKPILSPDLAKNLYPEVTTSISTTSSSNTEPSTITRPTFNSNGYRPTWKPIINQNKSSCEDLDRDDASGVYIFENNLAGRNSELFFNKRYCEIRGDGMWTVIQRRDNYTPQHNFIATWEDYKYGFGDLHRDFWMGNDFLYKASTTRELVLRIELEDFENNAVWAEYSIFVVSPESDNYRLTVGGYTGNASDSFSGHNGSFFSTYDKTNDFAPECCPCSVSYGGGWWFNRCFESNLNGIYYKRPHDNNYFRGIIWEHWLGNYSLKKSVMMIKSKARDYYGHPTPPENSNTDTIPYYEDP